MASQILDMVSSLYSFVEKQKNMAKDIQFQYNLLKISLTGIMEGLQSYQSASMDGETQTIICLKDQIQQAKSSIENTDKMNSSCFSHLLKANQGQKYVDDLKETIVLLDLAHESLVDQVSLTNQGAQRSKNIFQETLNKEIIQQFEGSESALIFWRDNVLEKAYNLPASKCVNYFQDFLNTYNSREPIEKRILPDRIDLIFQQLFDQDGDGRISVHELASFFKHIWDNETVRLKINLLNSGQEKDDIQYQLITQFCEEVNQKLMVRIFKMNSFTSNQLLSIEFNSFVEIYKTQIDEKALCQIFQKKQEFQQQKVFYDKLEAGCLAVVALVVKVAQQVMKAKTSGLLKLIEKDGAKYWIEDTEGGNGMCYLIKGDYLYLSYRNNWLCYSEPTKVINLKTHVTVFSLMNQVCSWDQGYMMHRFKSGTVFYCYSGHDAIRDCKYQLVKSIRDQETFMGLQYLDPKTNKYAKEGEFVFIRNDMLQYKDYYKKGDKVDWKQYKKIGLEHQLDLSKLKSIQKSVMV